jgi:hypothetical protein
MKEMAIAVCERLRRRGRTVPQIISIYNVNQKVAPKQYTLGYPWIPFLTILYQIGVRHANLQAKSHIDNSTAGFAADLLGAETSHHWVVGVYRGDSGLLLIVFSLT